jgi:probable phosphoglycerate mutase
MTTIFLVRHGITDWTGKRIIGNLPGVHLNEIGRAQAQKAGAFLQRYPIQAVFSSPMERAMETAEPLATALGLPVTAQESLREINFGELQGCGEELNESPLWHKFQTHPTDVTFSGGESVRTAQERVVTGLNEIAGRFGTGHQVACFCHCEILRLAVAYALRMPLEHFMRLTVKPASISCLEWEKDTQRLTLLNFLPD